MKLTLDNAPVNFEAIHPETGIRFDLCTLSPRKYRELQDKSKGKNGQVDSLIFARNTAEYIIQDWQRPDPANPELPCIDAECTAENKRAFGEKFAFTINPWLIDKAMDVETQNQDEVKEAKNV